MNEFNKIIEKELSLKTGPSIINLIDHLIKYASDINASDIHIDPVEKSVRVRFRIDGVLEDAHPLPKEIHSEIISRIKVLSGLRTDEHNAAQDGRFRSMVLDKGSVDIRVSIVPTYHGENAVLRLLSDNAENFTLDTLGFTEVDQDKIRHAIKRPSGMILVTGPTGSGKTTTLYTIIKMLNSKEISIVTIEDPIEYAVDGIEQIQVNPRTGLTFANGLRSILRQDPNVIMVGEIRDTETASIAVNTALTGHLLLSTLHTNDVSTTLPRLLDMKIEPFLVASTVSIAIGQRLVRKICENCKEKKSVTEQEYKRLLETVPENILSNNKEFFYGKGCRKCNDTGYKGRLVIAEVLVADESIRKTILSKGGASDIKELSIKAGMTTMLVDGFQKALKGLTTIEEVLRVTHE
ncbi:MAG: type pilus assembly protein PilB [Patescibacteria group bacterium]|nr:type II/IV secretion system protein [Candidatus Paceibacterota bacterium]MDQ5957598.1 type pilus assembly protein PilB [Patescibacteria group bacterium]